MKENRFRIYGTVNVSETGKGVPNLIVEALDKDLIYDDHLGSVITKNDGRFEIIYTKEDFQDLFFERRPDIYLRVRRPDGRVIHTTEDKIRYEADKVEAFHIIVQQALIEEENEMIEYNYKIEGRINPEAIKGVPGNLSVKIYAIRDRRVIGSSPIGADGGFSIDYQYDVHVKGEQRLPIGTYLTIGPNLPGDRILKEKFPSTFLPAEAFTELEGRWFAAVPEAITTEIFNKSIIEDWWEIWWKINCREWRPCVQVLACSNIQGGACYDEQPQQHMHVRIYEMRLPLIYFIGQTPVKQAVLVAEGDTDLFGYFKAKINVCKFLFLYSSYGYVVELSQKINGAYTVVYKDPEDQPRALKNDLCEEIYVLKSGIVLPTPAEGPLTGNVFKLTRVGNIPVGYIKQDSASTFYGYANSMTATDSATIKVVDSAFYAGIKLFANIGAGINDTVKYYRIKCSYLSNGVQVENYIQVPFNNLRESTPAEEASFGPYKTEFMGPIESNIYAYPNPYDLATDKQWIYKGLLMVLDTATLPLSYGLYTLSMELLDKDKKAIEKTILDSSSVLSFTMMVDNTVPTGMVGDIQGPNNQVVTACGFLKLPPPLTGGTRNQVCGGVTTTRYLVNGKISVPFSAQDAQGHIEHITLDALFGCNESTSLLYQQYGSNAPDATPPLWYGNNNFNASRTGDWDECAYQFRLTIFKRVTNGEVAYPWWSFTKHITLMRT